MVRLIIVALVILSLVAGVYVLSQKISFPSKTENQSSTISRMDLTNTTAEEDLTALERDLAELKELDKSFQEELNNL